MQPKKGFAIPAYVWLQTVYADRARQEMGRESALGCSLISRQERERALTAAIAGDLASQYRVWALMILNKWGDRWT